MAIVSVTDASMNVRLHPTYRAATLAELQSNAASYLDKYVVVTDQQNQIYYVRYNRAQIEVIPAYQHQHYTTQDAGIPVFIGDSPPVMNTPSKYLWIQTNYQTPDGFTLWFEDNS